MRGRRFSPAPSLCEALQPSGTPERCAGWSTVTPRPWSLGASSSVSQLQEDQDEEDLSTPDFVERALAAGFSKSDLIKAEAALRSGATTSSLPHRIIDAVASHRGMKPSRGPLPQPRASPPVTLGDVQTKDKRSTKTHTKSPSALRQYAGINYIPEDVAAITGDR